MSRARRLAALAAGLALAVVPLRSSTAQAEGPWTVTDWSAVVAAGPASSAVTVTGTIVYEPTTPDEELYSRGARFTRVRLTLTRTPALAGCAPAFAEDPGTGPDDDEVDPQVPDPEPPPDPPSEPPSEPPRTEPLQFSFDITVSPRCNGTYTASVVGTLDGAGPPPPDESDDEVSPSIGQVDRAGNDTHTVDVAPPDVRNAAASFDPATGVVGVAWQPPAGYGEANGCSATPAADHPDFAGYVVQRAFGDSESFATLPNGNLAMGTQCLFDRLPADAVLGQYRYRVRASRSGSTGLVLSGGVITTVTVGAAPPPNAPPATAAPGSPSSGRVSAGGPAVAPGATVPPAADDGTFDETLDYPEFGEEAAVIPDDAEAFLDFVPSPGEGILVPFAIAECLAVWAFHLRYLARRADDGF